jgi:hypothetical protein
VARQGPRPTGDRDALLAALPPRIRDGVLDALEVLKFGPEWTEAPSVARFVELVAFCVEVERIRQTEGESAEAARVAAGIRLGLSDESVDRQLRRQRDRSRGRTKCPGSSGVNGVTLVDDDDTTATRGRRAR